jgi:hypothetical protein
VPQDRLLDGIKLPLDRQKPKNWRKTHQASFPPVVTGWGTWTRTKNK